MNFKKLSSCLDYRLIIKLRNFFMASPPSYVALLLHRYNQIKLEQKIIKRSEKISNFILYLRIIIQKLINICP